MFRILLFSIIFTVFAEARLMDFIRTVDWSKMGDSEFSIKSCKCEAADGKYPAGFKIKLYEPIAYIDITNTPWNSVALGIQFDKSMTRKQGSSRYNGKNRRYTHVISFPPLSVLNFVQDYICFERLSAPAFVYWSEILPTQTNDVMALITEMSRGPMSKAWHFLMASSMACSLDCASTSIRGETLNALHYCASCSGTTGNGSAYGNGRSTDPLSGSHVNVLVAVDSMHYAGILAKVSNANFTFSPTNKIPNSMCGPVYFPLGIKSQYMLNQDHPVAWDAVRIGMFRTSWAEFKNKPKSGMMLDNGFG